MSRELILLVLALVAGVGLGALALVRATRWLLSRALRRPVSSRQAALASALLLALGFGTAARVGHARIAEVETLDWRALEPLPGAAFLTTRTGRIHYVDEGEGPAILLLHGSGSSLADWQEGVIDGLAAHHRVIAFDDFGNGFSERNARFTYGYDLWVNEAIELLDALGVSHVTVIGHSVGGALACVLAADHSSRVDHVVTIGTGLTVDPQQLLPLVPGVGELLMVDFRGFTEPRSDRHRAALETSYRVRGTRAALLAYIRRQVAVDGLRLMHGVFEEIEAPILHLSGSRDANIAPAVARQLAERTGGRFVPIEGAAHSAHLDAPDRVVEEVERFLAERSSS